MDADGSGRKQIQIPSEGKISDLWEAVSPDGKWLAYFTGMTGSEPHDFALHLLSFSDGTSKEIADLIAPGYPENLRPIAETLDLTHYRSECLNIECLTSLTSSIFEFGIMSLSWSPDSRFLAFAAQIDGPSSDIYLYDIENQSIRRLTDEIQNIWNIGWAPDGEKVLYHAAVPGPVEPYVNWYMADMKINSPQSTSINFENYYFLTTHGWLTKNTLIYARDTTFYEPLVPGPKYVSVGYKILDGGVEKEIWTYGAEEIAIDQGNNSIIIATAGIEEDQVEEGTYLVSLDGSFKKLSDTTYVFIRDLKPFETFLGWDRKSELYGVSPNSEVKIPGDQGMIPEVSPDDKWFFVWENDRKLNLYSDNFQLRHSWSFDEGSKGTISWRPDSLGALIMRSGKDYYLSVPEGELKLVMIDPGISSNFIWIP